MDWQSSLPLAELNGSLSLHFCTEVLPRDMAEDAQIHLSKWPPLWEGGRRWGGGVMATGWQSLLLGEDGRCAASGW